MSRDFTYVSQIVEAINRIFSYTSDGRIAFFDSVLIQDAVIRNLEIVGEATKRISSEYRNRFPDLPWREMAGLRDVLVHDYDSVDLKIVWNVVENELLEIRNTLSSDHNEF